MHLHQPPVHVDVEYKNRQNVGSVRILVVVDVPKVVWKYGEILNADSFINEILSVRRWVNDDAQSNGEGIHDKGTAGGLKVLKSGIKTQIWIELIVSPIYSSGIKN